MDPESRPGLDAREGVHETGKDAARAGGRNRRGARGHHPGLPLALVLTGLVGGCDSDASGPVSNPYPDVYEEGSVTFRVESATALLEGEAVLEQRLIAANADTASEAVGVSFACPVLLRAYAHSSRRGVPAYDLAALVDCPVVARLVALEPGQADTSAFRTPFSTLRRELDARRYYLTGLVSLASGLHELTAGEIDLTP